MDLKSEQSVSVFSQVVSQKLPHMGPELVVVTLFAAAHDNLFLSYLFVVY